MQKVAAYLRGKMNKTQIARAKRVCERMAVKWPGYTFEHGNVVVVDSLGGKSATFTATSPTGYRTLFRTYIEKKYTDIEWEFCEDITRSEIREREGKPPLHG